MTRDEFATSLILFIQWECEVKDGSIWYAGSPRPPIEIKEIHKDYLRLRRHEYISLEGPLKERQK